MQLVKESSILVVDDNRSILTTVELFLKGKCKNLKTIPNPSLIEEELKSAHYDLVLMSMAFTSIPNTGKDGTIWLQHVKEFDPTISVIMITSYGDIDLALKTIELGASDFIIKPWNNQKLLATIENALIMHNYKTDLKSFKEKHLQVVAIQNENYETRLIGSSLQWQTVMNQAEAIALKENNVLIVGESGSGRSAIAKYIHSLSSRNQKVFIDVDADLHDESTLKNILLGYKKGANSEALYEKNGKIETAGGGVLLIKEVGKTPASVQSVLLSVYTERTFRKRGDTKKVKTDVRFISTTSQDMAKLVEDQRFNIDLLDALKAMIIEIPPLRDHLNDIPDLVEDFIRYFSKKYNKPGVGIAKKAMDKLFTHDWPGNITELKITIERAVISCRNNIIQVSDLGFKFEHDGSDIKTFDGTLEDVEKQIIQNVLIAQNGNLTAVANRLGITRQTLYNKISKYGLTT